MPNRISNYPILGYVVIYLLGLDTGCYVLPPEPAYLKKAGRSVNQVGKRLTVLASWATVWWTLFCVLGLPSRRTVSTPVLS